MNFRKPIYIGYTCPNCGNSRQIKRDEIIWDETGNYKFLCNHCNAKLIYNLITGFLAMEDTLQEKALNHTIICLKCRHGHQVNRNTMTLNKDNAFEFTCRKCSRPIYYYPDREFTEMKTEMDTQKTKEMKREITSALNKQEGGNHYKNMPIQPVEYIHKNNIGFLAGNAIKYLSRYKEKEGIEDIKKAIHYCEMILEMEYGTNQEIKENKAFPDILTIVGLPLVETDGKVFLKQKQHLTHLCVYKDEYNQNWVQPEDSTKPIKVQLQYEPPVGYVWQEV